MKNKYVLSIGAGIEQLPSIKIAKDLGFKVISCDYNKESIAKEYSDEFYNIDIKNEQEIINLAKQYNIEFILPAPIGRYLTTIGAVNDALKLKGISKKAASVCTDKYLFNNIFNSKINLAKQYQVKDGDDISNILSSGKMTTPFILKPRFGSGSKSVQVFKSNDKIDLVTYFNEKQFEDILMEKFIEGDEIGIDAVVRNGILEITLLIDKTITPLPYRQEVAYQTPSKYNNFQDEIYHIINVVIKELNINDSLINADFLVKNNRLYLIEISPRASGNNISSLMVPLSLKLNPLEMFIKFLNKEYIKLPKIINPIYFEFFHFRYHNIGKKVKSINFDLVNIKSLYLCNCKIKVGEYTSTIKDGTDTFNNGYFVLHNNSDIFTKDRESIYKGINYER